MLTKLANTFFPRMAVGKYADNRLARIADINSLVEALRRMSPFGADVYTAFVTHTGGLPNPTARAIACSCESNSNGGCPTCLNTCGYACKATVKNITTTSPGVYSLEIDPSGYDDFKDISVELSNLNVSGRISVAKVSTYVYTITTYNAAGEATSFLLNNTVMRISFYGNGGTDYIL